MSGWDRNEYFGWKQPRTSRRAGKLFQLKANSGKSDLFLIFPFFVSVALMRFHNMPSFSRLCLFYIVQPFSRKQECMCLILIFNVIHSVLSSHRINLFLTFSRKIKTISKFKCCKVKKLYDNSSANMHWQWRQGKLTQTSRQISGNTRNKVVEREEFFFLSVFAAAPLARPPI